APDGSDSARDAIRERFEADNGLAVRATQDVWAHQLKVRELDELSRTVKEQRARHAQVVQDFMGDATELISPYDTLGATFRAHSTTRVDLKALRAALPDVAAEFSVTSTTRRFEANPSHHHVSHAARRFSTSTCQAGKRGSI